MSDFDGDRQWREREFLAPLCVNREADDPALAGLLEERILAPLASREGVYAELMGHLPEALRPRFAEMALPLQLNALLACLITYRPGLEAYPARPSIVLSRGYGRCGELSTLLVRLLRCAGIPARQVYVPLWAHCDDNHAWVEFFWEGAWHFVGAAEPEWALDRGWFIPAASRAPWVGCRVESPPPGTRLPRLKGGGYLLTNNEDYFLPQSLNLSFRGAETVEFAPLLYNEGYLRPLAYFVADADEQVSLSLNRLALRLGIWAQEAYYELPLDPLSEADVVIDLTQLKPLYRQADLVASVATQWLSTEVIRQEAPPKTRSFPPSSHADRQADEHLVQACATIQKESLARREGEHLALLRRFERKGILVPQNLIDRLSLLGEVGTELLRDVDGGQCDEAALRRILLEEFERLLYGDALDKSPRRPERRPLNSEDWLLEDCRWGAFCLCPEGVSHPPLFMQVMRSFRQPSGALDILQLRLLLPEGVDRAEEMVKRFAPEWWDRPFDMEQRPRHKASHLLLELLGGETGIVAFLGERDEPSVRMRRELEKVSSRLPALKVKVYPREARPWQLQREYDLAENDLCDTLVLVNGEVIAAESGAEWSLTEVLQASREEK